MLQVADHIDHIRKIAGIDHVGLGGDFDGITSVPVGLEDVSTYPGLVAELLRRGWSDDDVRKLAGRNILRVMRGAEAAAAKLNAPPSESRTDDGRDSRRRVIVALGDSTTAGTPLFKSPVEAPPGGDGDRRSQFAYWLMQAHPDWQVLNCGVNGERSDEIARRFDRDVLAARPRRGDRHRRRERRLPGPTGRARHQPASRDLRSRRTRRHPGRRRIDRALQHGDAGSERADARRSTSGSRRKRRAIRTSSSPTPAARWPRRTIPTSSAAHLTSCTRTSTAIERWRRRWRPAIARVLKETDLIPSSAHPPACRRRCRSR